MATPGQQIPPHWPPAFVPVATSRCEPHRAFIEAQVRLGRNGVAIYQDLVDLHGFIGAYNSVKRCVAKLRHKEPDRFDRLSFLPGEEMQVNYGEWAPTQVLGTDKYRKSRLFVATLRYSRRSFRRVVWKSSQKVWAELHEQAWRSFGGSCRYVVLDNLKEGVLKPAQYYPELNPVFAATLAHCEVICAGQQPAARSQEPGARSQEQATLVKALSEPDLLVLDDLFLARRIPEAAAEVLQAVARRRYKLRSSIAITSNRVVTDWGKFLKDTTVLDRLTYRCSMREFEGKIYRIKEGASRLAINLESA